MSSSASTKGQVGDGPDLEMQTFADFLGDGVTHMKPGNNWSLAQVCRPVVETIAVVFLGPWRFALRLFSRQY